jgi:hypothetical protein
VLGAMVAAATLPASASATVTMTGFTVTPASKQAGGHPNVTITQNFGYGSSSSDSVKDAFVRLQPGMLGNPQAAAFCTQQQFHADTCPADSRVGSVVVSAKAHPIPIALLDPITTIPLSSKGVVYNLRPTGTEPARIGLVVAAVAVGDMTLSKIFLQSPVYIRPGADGYGLESTFADQPRKSNGIPIQITKVALTFNGKASRGSFMRMPTSCAQGTSLSRANSWDAQNVFSQKTVSMTPTGCDALGFSPKAQGFMGSAASTKKGSVPPVATTLSFDPEQAALKRAEVTLPSVLAANPAVILRACPKAQSDASACPASSRVGTAIIDSPLQPQPVRGPVYLAYNSSNPLPGLVVMLPPPVAVRLDGLVDLTTEGARNTFPSNPDLPVRSFTLSIDGDRPDGLLQLTRDLCDPRTDRTMELRLVAHNGKVSTFSQELATPGCDPTATFSIRRHGHRAALVARLRAASVGPGLTQFTLKLPKTLSRGKTRPIVFAGGSRMRPVTRRRMASMPFPGEVRTATIVWRGLKAGRRLRKMTKIRLSVTDGRPHVTSLTKHVKVVGKSPHKKRHEKKR